MPNPHSVYMHDTPSRNLFANDYRFLSHGCVRVQGVVDLAAWLLDGESGPQMSKDEINAKIASGEREEVKLTQHRAGGVGLYDRLGVGGRHRAFPRRRLSSRRSDEWAALARAVRAMASGGSARIPYEPYSVTR